jgi:hypothetical protein
LAGGTVGNKPNPALRIDTSSHILFLMREPEPAFTTNDILVFVAVILFVLACMYLGLFGIPPWLTRN